MPVDRCEEIIRALREKGPLNTSELARKLMASTCTIKKFLVKLARKKIVGRKKIRKGKRRGIFWFLRR